MKAFQTISEWVLRLVWTNLLWIGFTLFGFIVLGIIPATIALFTVTRKWTMKEYHFSIWNVFKETYFAEWKNSNKIGIIFWLVGLLLFFDLSFSEQMEGFFSLFLYVFFLFLTLIFILTIVYFFPIYVHYTLPNKEYMKQSFIYAFVSLKETILIIIGLFFIGYLLYKLPGLIPFMSGSLVSYWIMKVCMKRFRYLESKI